MEDNINFSKITNDSSLDSPITSINNVQNNFEEINNEKKISQLENDIFVISNQLKETKDLLNDASNQNALFKEHNNALELDKLENVKLIQVLEKSRNDLTMEKSKLQEEKIQLKSQRDSFEAELNKILIEKRRLTEELQALKVDFLQERKEKALLQIKIDDFEIKENSIEYDKKRWSHEKEILVQGKQWCMNEISARETKLNEIRIETMKLESKFNQEKQLLLEERDLLSTKVEDLNESLLKKENEVMEIRNRLQKIIDERALTLNEMESELRAKERLTELYKSSLDFANNEISVFKESEEKLQADLQENEINIINLNSELDNLTASRNKEIKERDEIIKKLNEELMRANELLKIQARVHHSDEEIAALSPAAAATSKLIRSGISLTSIYTEHCRVVSELEKKSAQNELINRYVTELIEELDAKAPLLREQREFYENSAEEIKRLNIQNKLISENFQQLQNSRDSIARELVFTKAELDRYQHEHQALTVQVRRLLYNIERSDSTMETNFTAEEYLFSNIQDLHNANLQLISKVKKLEEEIAEKASSVALIRLETLKQNLQDAEKELDYFRNIQSKNDALIFELTSQRDKYKSLYDEIVIIQTNNSPSFKTSTFNLEKSNNDVINWKLKADLLQEKLDFFNKENQDSTRAFNNRIDQQIEQISQLRTTNGKLESALEFQKKNQQILTKNINELEKELKKSKECGIRLNAHVENLRVRNDDISNQILNYQQQISQLKITIHSLEEQLNVSKNNELQATTELNILRKSSNNSERIAYTLQEVEMILKQIDADKHNSSNSQLESTRIERDNLKQLIENLTINNNQLSDSLKSTINSLSSERDKAIDDLAILQEHNNKLENQIIKIKEEHEKCINDSFNLNFTEENSVMKKEIDQIKLKNINLKELTSNLEVKCHDLVKLNELKENELIKVRTFSDNIESSIKEQNERLVEKDNQIDNLNQKLEKTNQELIAKSHEVEEKTNTAKNINNLLLQAKALARNFRDGNKQLESERDNLKVEVENLKLQLNEKSNVVQEKSAEISTSWTNICAENQAQQSAKLLLQQKIQENQKINTENQTLYDKLSQTESVNLELEKKIKEMKTELEEANEKCFRLDSITSMLNYSRKRNEQLRDELLQKETEVEELKQSLSQSPSRKRTFSNLIPFAEPTEEHIDKRSKMNQENVTLQREPNTTKDENFDYENDFSSKIVNTDIFSKETPIEFDENLNNENVGDEEDELENEDFEEEGENDEEEHISSDYEEFDHNYDLQVEEIEKLKDASDEVICLSEDDDYDPIKEQHVLDQPPELPINTLVNENSLEEKDKSSLCLTLDNQNIKLNENES